MYILSLSGYTTTVADVVNKLNITPMMDTLGRMEMKFANDYINVQHQFHMFPMGNTASPFSREQIGDYLLSCGWKLIGYSCQTQTDGQATVFERYAKEME